MFNSTDPSLIRTSDNTAILTAKEVDNIDCRPFGQLAPGIVGISLSL